MGFRAERWSDDAYDVATADAAATDDAADATADATTDAAVHESAAAGRPIYAAALRDVTYWVRHLASMWHLRFRLSISFVPLAYSSCVPSFARPLLLPAASSRALSLQFHPMQSKPQTLAHRSVS